MSENKGPANIAGMLKKRFDLLITTGDTTYTQTFELDKTIAYVRGILLSSDKDDLLYYRGTQKIEVNKLELFPEGYESKLLMSGINAPVNHRYYLTGDLEIGNGQLKVEYKDKDDVRAPFEVYRVSIYVNCELKGYL